MSARTNRPWTDDETQHWTDPPFAEDAGYTRKSGGAGRVVLVVLVLLLVCAVGWMLYAYNNPHTPSGQLLIKYRPSKWQIPSSHVRYSASVHM